MKQQTLIRLFVLPVVALAVAVMVGCSEKTVNPPVIGDANIAIDIQASPAETMQLVEVYVLTVSAPDMETVVDTLQLIDNRFVVGVIAVPVGERRLFVLEGIRGAAMGLPQVVYRGQTTARVAPGTVTTLNITLQPVAPMARLSPVQSEVIPAAGWSLDLSVYNLPPVQAVRFVVEWDRAYLSYPEVTLSETLGENVIVLLNGLDVGIEIIVGDTTHGSIVDGHGHASLVSLVFPALTFVQEFPVPASAGIIAMEAIGLEGEPVSTADVLFENAHARLLPIEDRVVVFPDPALNSTIRGLVTIQEPIPLMLSDVIHLTYLSFGEVGVANLSGIEYLVNLINLEMSYNLVSDLSSLMSLTQLRYLYAESNQLQNDDLPYLAGMTELRSLNLSRNSLTSILPLALLTRLENLDLGSQRGDFQIVDITPLAGMTNMRWLYLYENDITDISVLAGMPDLRYVSLYDNQITDIRPLVDNPGIDSGDVVEIWYNGSLVNDPVQQGYIQDLRNREVIVYDYPPF